MNTLVLGFLKIFLAWERLNVAGLTLSYWLLWAESWPLTLEYTPFSETQLRPGPLTLLADRL